MTHLIALIKADFVKIFHAGFIYPLIPVILVVLAFFYPPAILMPLLITVYLIGYGIIAYDETYKAQNYYAFLPITRTAYVYGKYLHGLVSMVVLIGASFLASFLGQFLIETPNRPLGNELVSLYLSALVLVLVFLALQLPFSLLLGGVKGRFVSMFLYLGAFMLLFNHMDMVELMELTASISLPLLVLIGLFVYCISCFITTTFYNIKDLA